MHSSWVGTSRAPSTAVQLGLDIHGRLSRRETHVQIQVAALGAHDRQEGLTPSNGADVHLRHAATAVEAVLVLGLVAPPPVRQGLDHRRHAHQGVAVLGEAFGMRDIRGVARAAAQDRHLEERLAGLDPGDAEAGGLGHHGVVADDAVGDEVAGADLLGEIAGGGELVDGLLADLTGDPGDDEVAGQRSARCLHRLGRYQRAGKRPLVVDEAVAHERVALPPGGGVDGVVGVVHPAPLLGTPGHVHVGVEDHRVAPAGAPEAAHDVGPIREHAHL